LHGIYVCKPVQAVEMRMFLEKDIEVNMAKVAKVGVQVQRSISFN